MYSQNLEESFIDTYELKVSHNVYEIPTKLTYYATTTLATIGLGDFHPISNLERIISIIMMLAGVSIFTFIHSQVQASISKVTELVNPLSDQQTQLDSFFGVLKRFNNKIPINQEFRNQLLIFFEFRWDRDRTQALRTDNDKALFDQLPEGVRGRIYSDFLFDDFLKKFRSHLTFPEDQETTFKSTCRLGILNWDDPGFMSFAIGLLNLLEPVVYQNGEVITEEKSSSPSLIFILKGAVELMMVKSDKPKRTVGRVLASKILMKLEAGNTVGVETLIDIKSLFDYRCSSKGHHVDGLFIRKVNWARFSLKHQQENDCQLNIL